MTIKNVKKEIEKVNDFLLATTDTCFHFQLIRVEEGLVKIAGSADITAHYKVFNSIEIEFADPVFIKTVIHRWDLKKEKSFIELITLDESLEKLSKIDYPKNKCFAFRINIKLGEHAFIVAKSIKSFITKAE